MCRCNCLYFLLQAFYQSVKTRQIGCLKRWKWKFCKISICTACKYSPVSILSLQGHFKCQVELFCCNAEWLLGWKLPRVYYSSRVSKHNVSWVSVTIEDYRWYTQHSSCVQKKHILDGRTSELTFFSKAKGRGSLSNQGLIWICSGPETEPRDCSTTHRFSHLWRLRDHQGFLSLWTAAPCVSWGVCHLSCLKGFLWYLSKHYSVLSRLQPLLNLSLSLSSGLLSVLKAGASASDLGRTQSVPGAHMHSAHIPIKGYFNCQA